MQRIEFKLEDSYFVKISSGLWSYANISMILYTKNYLDYFKAFDLSC